MSKDFAIKILDGMVDESGHCGDRALSAKQFLIISDYLYRGETEIVGGWNGNYKTIDFTSTNHEGNIGKYHVVLNEFWHFNPRYTVVSIDLRDADEYQAELDAEAKLKALRDFSGSEWVAEPKKRIDLDLTLVDVYEYEATKFSYYDSSTGFIYKFRDADGNCIVWKTKKFMPEWCPDDMWNAVDVEVRATVKEHTEYRGVKQTVINRPQFKSIN